jgi:hypothetical protein
MRRLPWSCETPTGILAASGMLATVPERSAITRRNKLSGWFVAQWFWRRLSASIWSCRRPLSTIISFSAFIVSPCAERRTHRLLLQHRFLAAVQGDYLVQALRRRLSLSTITSASSGADRCSFFASDHGW